MGSLEEARTRGFPSPPFGRYGFFDLVGAYAVHADYATDSGSECPLFSPKQPFRSTDLDSVRMSAFGQKRTFSHGQQN